MARTRIHDREKRVNLHTMISPRAYDVIQSLVSRHQSNPGRVVDYLTQLYDDQLIQGCGQTRPARVAQNISRKEQEQEHGQEQEHQQGLISFF